MDDLIQLLQSVRCPVVFIDNVKAGLIAGPQSIIFTQLVSWITSALQAVLDLESSVNPIMNPSESPVFMIEMSSLLRELNCPHSSLTEGPVDERLSTLKDRSLLIFYLVTELQAAQINWIRRKNSPRQITVEVRESPTAKKLKCMLIALNFKKPPPTITPMMLFTRVERKLIELANQALDIDPLFSHKLSDDQWFQLSTWQAEMHNEFRVRRAMMLTRLDVTIQSFNWSERLEKSGEAIREAYTSRRKALLDEPAIHISDVLAAKKDLLLVEAASSASVRAFTRSSVNQVVIGNVPDRGGRPEEQQPPPPEIPSWQKNEPARSGANFQKPGVISNVRGGSQGRNMGSEQQSGMKHHDSHASATVHSIDGVDCRGRGTQYQMHQKNASKYSSHQSGAPVRAKFDCSNSGYNMSNHFQHAVPFAPPHNINMYPQYSVSSVSQEGLGFGVGIGGYGATGGNFQQYGIVHQVGYADEQLAPNRAHFRNRGAGGDFQQCGVTYQSGYTDEQLLVGRNNFRNRGAGGNRPVGRRGYRH